MTQAVWATSIFALLGITVGATVWWFLRGQRNVVERITRRRSEIVFCQEALHSSAQLQQWGAVEGTSCIVAVSDTAVEILTVLGRPHYRYTWDEVRSLTETEVRRGVVDVPGVELRVTNRWEDPVRLTFSRGAAFSSNADLARDFVAAVNAAIHPTAGGGR